MSTSGCRPFFLPGPAGQLFAIYYSQCRPADNISNLVYVPPFAEEMNRSRRMAALQARDLARRGVGVLLLDLYGTGDSQGEFCEATWEIWAGDVAAGISWLRAEGSVRTGVWGTRLGGLLAMAVARRVGDIDHAILWNPITSGRNMLKQFLRIRVATEMHGSGKREDTNMLRERLRAGEAIEVAGYTLTRALTESLETTELAASPPCGLTKVDWFQLVSEEGSAIPPAPRSIVQNWRQQGSQVSLKTCVGEPFWSLQEITVAANLIDATSALFEPEIAK